MIGRKGVELPLLPRLALTIARRLIMRQDLLQRVPAQAIRFAGGALARSLSSARADELLSKTPCRIALLGLPAKLGKIEADAAIFPTSRDAPMCAAIFNRRDYAPAPPF